MKLNLGAGKSRIEGFIPVDIHDYGDNVVHDLRNPLPFPSDSCDEFILSHVLEHVPDRLALMSEIYRVAKPNAKLHIAVPFAFSDESIEDPTHLHHFTFNSFVFFSQPAYCNADYGYRADWDHSHVTVRVRPQYLNHPDLLNLALTQRNIGVEIIATLRAVKPARPALASLLKVPEVRFI